MWKDFVIGWRTAVRSPGYSAIVVVTVALAIGANTLLFSIANPMVARPLPFKNQDSLGWLRQTYGPARTPAGALSIADFLDLRSRSQSFSEVAAWTGGAGTVFGDGEPRRVSLARATTNLAGVWGLSPAAGRLFSSGEDSVGAAPVAVLSHRFWRELTDASPGIINQTINLDGEAVTVVGVMEPKIEFGGLGNIDIWMPLPLAQNEARDARRLTVVGRLAPGATIESADAEVKRLAAQLATEFPVTNSQWDIDVVRTMDFMTSGDTWVILGLMAVVVGFVLLIACASLGNLVRARLSARRRDLTVRRALGASRLEVIRPLLSESLVLGMIGGGLGLALAYGGIRLITAVTFDSLLRTLSIDGNVLLFNSALSIITPLVFSVWPAFSQTRTMDTETLRASQVRGSRHARRSGRVLIVFQVALALSLLIASALTVQSMWTLQNAPTGLNMERVVTFKLDLPPARYPDDAASRRLVEQLLQDLGQVPGVDAVAVGTHLSLFDGVRTRNVSSPSGVLAQGTDLRASWQAVSPRFFETLGMAMLAGRPLADTDEAGRQQVAVVGRTMADRYFGSPELALDRTVVLTAPGGGSEMVTIVGVVDDVRSPRSTSTPQVYVPFNQMPTRAVTVALSSADPKSRIPDARAALKRLDSSLALTLPKTLTERSDEQNSGLKIINALFAGFALLALVLAAAGLYGVTALTLGERRNEIAVRLALGAQPQTIRWMILSEGLMVSATGLLVGLGLAWMLAQASASLLFGLSPHDYRTFGLATLCVAGVAFLTVWIPATRARRINPVTALRAT